MTSTTPDPMTAPLPMREDTRPWFLVEAEKAGSYQRPNRIKQLQMVSIADGLAGISSTGPPPEHWYKRWSNHTVLYALKSALKGQLSSTEREIVGIGLGGIMLGVFNGECSFYFLRWLLGIAWVPMAIWYVVGFILTMLDPIPIIQHMTPINGNEDFEARVVWAASFIFIKDVIHRYVPADILDSYDISTFRVFMFLTAIWNFHKGDYRNKVLAWYCKKDRENHLGEDHIELTLSRFSRYHSQVGSGISMMLAVFGLYSAGSFAWLVCRTLLHGVVSAISACLDSWYFIATLAFVSIGMGTSQYWRG